MQGDSRCMFDSVEQQPLPDAALPPHIFQVSARGFCTVPARAVDGDGSVLLIRFDFSGLVPFQEDDGAAPAPLAGLPRSEIQVVTAGGRHVFQVWIADNDQSREQGLMFIKELPADQGMLFLFDRPQFAAFWMKNTYLSLDIVFIAPNGVVVNIARDARPLSERPIESDAPVTGVPELVAGTAARIGLTAGDRIVHTAFAPQQSR